MSPCHSSRSREGQVESNAQSHHTYKDERLELDEALQLSRT
jgi:hypothetical protein